MKCLRLFVTALCSVMLSTCELSPAQATDQPKPLAAIAVSQCGKALSLFIQLDATHLLRADPRQSDLFVAQSDGTMRHVKAAPMQWEDAYKLALSAVITTHVTVPCTDGPTI